MPRPLDSDGQASLVLCAGPGLSPIAYLTAIRHISTEHAYVLVVDHPGLLETECTDLAPWRVAAPCVSAATGWSASARTSALGSRLAAFTSIV